MARQPNRIADERRCPAAGPEGDIGPGRSVVRAASLPAHLPREDRVGRTAVLREPEPRRRGRIEGELEVSPRDRPADDIEELGAVVEPRAAAAAPLPPEGAAGTSEHRPPIRAVSSLLEEPCRGVLTDPMRAAAEAEIQALAREIDVVHVHQGEVDSLLGVPREAQVTAHLPAAHEEAACHRWDGIQRLDEVARFS